MKWSTSPRRRDALTPGIHLAQFGIPNEDRFMPKSNFWLIRDFYGMEKMGSNFSSSSSTVVLGTFDAPRIRMAHIFALSSRSDESFLARVPSAYSDETSALVPGYRNTAIHVKRSGGLAINTNGHEDVKVGLAQVGRCHGAGSPERENRVSTNMDRDLREIDILKGNIWAWPVTVS